MPRPQESSVPVTEAIEVENSISYKPVCIDGYEYKIVYDDLNGHGVNYLGVVQTLNQDYEGNIKFKKCY